MTQPWASKGARVAVLLQTLALAAAATVAAPVFAAVSVGGSPVATHPTLVGQTASGQTISLNGLRGQVVLVMVWSTDCSVCLSKMPELRANLAGWHTKGFQIISINTDARPDPLRSWEAARLVTVPPSQQWPSLWKGAPGFATSLTLDAPNATGATHLPSIYVLDRAGKLRMHTTGRVPAEVWDTIAELL